MMGTTIDLRHFNITMNHSVTVPPTLTSSRGWGRITWTLILLTRRLCSSRGLPSYNLIKSTGNSWWQAVIAKQVCDQVYVRTSCLFIIPQCACTRGICFLPINLIALILLWSKICLLWPPSIQPGWWAPKSLECVWTCVSRSPLINSQC